jgi:hypothetical protein
LALSGLFKEVLPPLQDLITLSTTIMTIIDDDQDHDDHDHDHHLDDDGEEPRWPQSL